MNRTRVLLLFGGESAEHDVSTSSARNVFAALDDTTFEISLVYIGRDGHWWLVDSIDDYHTTAGKCQVVPVMGSGTFVTIPESKTLQPDVILPILHGTNGEDGAIQGVAQMLHIPIVGCDILSSAICMDKEVCKRLLQGAGLPVVDYQVYRAGDPLPEFSQINMKLGVPLFVKPANEGSSVGVSKVYNEAEFAEALQTALKYDRKVLIEKFAAGRELECAVLGNDQPQASGVGEVTTDDFYTYEAKYSPTSQAKVTIPAELPEGALEKIQQLAVEAYRTLGCRGLARVDCFLTEDGQVYVNELNTLPGFTNISMFPKLWRESGLGYPQLIERLIKLALEDAPQTETVLY